MREPLKRARPPATAIWLTVLALGGCAAAAVTSEEPRVIPLPKPPRGPEIRRVTHDAAPTVHQEDRVTITVLAAPGASVTASIGDLVTGIRCAPRAEEPGAYVCEAQIPPGSPGNHRVRARATDSSGRTSELSAALPVVVKKIDIWRLLNTLNARIQPVFFAAGSDQLDAAARSAVEASVELLEAHPSLPIAIEGHCDSTEEGDLQELSSRRAEAVLEELKSLGIPNDRMKTTPLGATQPLSASRNETERALNRRAIIGLEPAPSEEAP